MDKLTKNKVMRPSLIDAVDKINEIIDAIDAVETLSPTASASTGVTVHRVQGFQLGKLVMVKIQLSTSKTFANNDVMAQLAGLPAPSVDILQYLSNGDSEGMTISIINDLKIRCAGGTSKNHSWVGSTFTYITG